MARRPGTPVEALARRVRDNEAIWNELREIEKRMIGAASLAEVVGAVGRGIPAAFPGVERAVLAWLDPEHHARRLWQHGGGSPRDFIPLDRLPAEPVACLGDCEAALLAGVFPDRPPEPACAALVPLVLRGRPRGWLGQLARRPGHFHPGQDTTLLEHFAAVAALCVEAALNRERLRRDGLTDPLTGIPNRRFFEERLAEEVRRLRRRPGAAALLLVDVDRFKNVNDRHGHQAGDRVLQAVARALAAGLRESDVLARWGGEEFVILLPDTPLGAAGEIAERLRRRVMGAGCRPAVTVSIGLAAAAGDPGIWLERADRALYGAKAAGRNRVVVA